MADSIHIEQLDGGSSGDSSLGNGRGRYIDGVRTLTEINYPILNGKDLTRSNYFQNASAGVYYTPYDSDRSWTSRVAFPEYSTQSASAHAESDYWSDPRFQSKLTGNLALSPGTYTIDKLAAGGYQVISNESGSVLATIPKGVSEILVLLQGAGGGGAGGGNATYYSTYHVCGGGGGGSGACAAVAFALEEACSTGYNPFISVGSGGAAGTWNSQQVPQDGGDGSSTYISLKGDILCSAGGGTGGKAAKFNPPNYQLIDGDPGEGGGYTKESAYIHDLYGSFAFEGHSGGRGWVAHPQSSSTSLTGNAGTGDGGAVWSVLKSWNTTGEEFASYDSIEFAPKTSVATSGASRSAGAASKLSNGTSDHTSTGIGAGGAGGGDYTRVASSYSLYKEPGKGGDGVMYLWWPQEPSGWVDFSAPVMSQSISAGEHYVTVTNMNAFSVTLRYTVVRTEAGIEAGFLNYMGEQSIASGGSFTVRDADAPELLVGDVVTAAFVSGVNASYVRGITVTESSQS